MESGCGFEAPARRRGARRARGRAWIGESAEGAGSYRFGGGSVLENLE